MGVWRVESPQNILRLYTCLKYTFSTVFIISLGPFIPFSHFQSYEVNKKNIQPSPNCIIFLQVKQKGVWGAKPPQEKFWGLGLNPPPNCGSEGWNPRGGLSPPLVLPGGGPTPPAPPPLVRPWWGMDSFICIWSRGRERFFFLWVIKHMADNLSTLATFFQK